MRGDRLLDYRIKHPFYILLHLLNVFLRGDRHNGKMVSCILVKNLSNKRPKLKSIHFRHVDVQQSQVKNNVFAVFNLGLQLFQSHLPRKGTCNPDSGEVILHDLLENIHIEEIVIHNQHTLIDDLRLHRRVD